MNRLLESWSVTTPSCEPATQHSILSSCHHNIWYSDGSANRLGGLIFLFLLLSSSSFFLLLFFPSKIEEGLKEDRWIHPCLCMVPMTFIVALLVSSIFVRHRAKTFIYLAYYNHHLNNKPRWCTPHPDDSFVHIYKFVSNLLLHACIIMVFNLFF